MIYSYVPHEADSIGQHDATWSTKNRTYANVKYSNDVDSICIMSKNVTWHLLKSLLFHCQKPNIVLKQCTFELNVFYNLQIHQIVILLIRVWVLMIKFIPVKY